MLSLLWPGLGQVYNGEVDKGVAMGAFQAINFGVILSFPASALLLNVVPAWLYWADVPIVCLWAVADARRTAEEAGRAQSCA